MNITIDMLDLRSVCRELNRFSNIVAPPAAKSGSRYSPSCERWSPRQAVPKIVGNLARTAGSPLREGAVYARWHLMTGSPVLGQIDSYRVEFFAFAFLGRNLTGNLGF